MPEPLRKHWFVLCGLLVLAFNLRPAAGSIGPVLAEIKAGLGMSGTEAGLLTSLPVLAFAAFGAMAPAAAARFGVHRVTLVSLTLLVVGVAARSTVHSPGAFLALSLVALSGMAAANVLLPSLIKLHFADRIGLLTALYTTTLALGQTLAITLTVPLADLLGGWRAGLGCWAGLGLIAAVPWLRLIGHDRHLAGGPHEIGLLQVARTRLGMAMALAFGLQSLQAYVMFGWFAQLWRDSGYSAAAGGVLVGLISAVTIPLSLLLPPRLAKMTDPRPLLAVILACYPISYVGLLVAPYGGAVLWALTSGVASAIFPLILTLIGLRSKTAAGTAALSGFTQSAGYLIAAVGPFTVGAINAATGGWTWPLLFLLATVAPLTWATLAAGRPAAIEDQLR